MKQLLFIMWLLCIGTELCAQAIPSGWTTHYRLRKYAQGSNPGADSLNANWTEIDQYIYDGLHGRLRFDSTVVSEFMRFYRYNDSTKAWADLEGGPNKPKLRFRVRDDGSRDGGIYATLSAVSKAMDSTYAEVFISNAGYAGFGGRRINGSAYWFWQQVYPDSSVWGTGGTRRMKLYASGGFSVGTPDWGDPGVNNFAATRLKTSDLFASDSVYSGSYFSAYAGLVAGNHADAIKGRIYLLNGDLLNPYNSTLIPNALTANRTHYLPDSSGTLALASSIGIKTLNTLSGTTQTFATGTSGSDFAISSSGTTHTFNIPSASASNRGVVTTGTQTFAGTKTFSDVAVTGTVSAIGTITSGDNSNNGAMFIWHDAWLGGLIPATQTGSRTWTLPNVSGTIITTGNLSSITDISSAVFGSPFNSGLWVSTASGGPTDHEIRVAALTFGGTTYYVIQ